MFRLRRAGTCFFEDRHLSSHEAVEQRHGECRLAMPLAPYHALVHQLLPDRRYGGCAHVQGGGDVPCLVRSRSEFGHGAQVLLLQHGQAVETHAEKVGVEVGDHVGRRVRHYFRRDRT